jgi:hypothetical protein
MPVGYLKWNELLGEFFFKPGCEGKIVTLVISPEDVVAIARKSQLDDNGTLGDQDIMEEFKQSWRAGHPGISGNIIEKIILEDKRGMTFYSRGRDTYRCDGITVTYPPVLMHLAGIIIAIIEGSDPSRYKRIRQFFNVIETKFPNMHEHLNWNTAWDNLIWWANSFKKGSLGLLPAKSLSTERFEYMGKPYTFIMLSHRQLSMYHQYFFDNDMEPQAGIDNHDLVLAFKKVKGNDAISRLLGADAESADKQLVLAILWQLYRAWDGSCVKPSDSANIKVSYLSRKLKLCFETGDDGYVNFFFRFKEDVFTGAQLQFEQYSVSFSSNQWSTPIPLGSIPQKKIFSDVASGLKLVFKPAEGGLFIFINGRTEGLNSQTWIETDHIHYAANQFLLVKNGLASQLQAWIGSNNGVNLSRDWLNTGDQCEWQLYQFADGFQASFSAFDKLSLPLTASLTVQSGLKGTARGEYITGFPVILNLSGARGNEVLRLSGPKEYQFNLIDGQVFEIPGHMEPGSYTLELPGDQQYATLPNNGCLVFSPMSTVRDAFDELEPALPFPDGDDRESRHYKQSAALVNNNLFTYGPAPQFNLWQADLLSLDQLDQRTIAAIKLLEYLVTKATLSKMAFEQALSIIKSNSGESVEDFDFYKVSKYTLNGLKEGSRVTLEFSQSGSVNNVNTVKPWLFRLGNSQNFHIPGLNTGIQPFKGCLYALGGAYTLELLEALAGICHANGASLKICREGSPLSLVPPSIFIYAESNHFSVDKLTALLGQQVVLPYYHFLTAYSPLAGKIEEFKNGRMLDLHMPDRYQYFDTDSLLFKSDPDGLPRAAPSLSLYTVQAWERYHILRFEQDGTTYQSNVDPRWGKYILLYLLGINGLFCFDEQTNTLYIPASLRLPAGMEDNLFFLTGRMPSAIRLRAVNNTFEVSSNTRAGRTYLAYKGILKSTAAAVAQNAGQQLISKLVLDHGRSL